MNTETLLAWGLNPNFITPAFLQSQDLPESLPWRFISKVKKTDDCWLWAAGKQNGYGRLSSRNPTQPVYAHRLSWLLHFGPIPSELWVLHDCPNGDNRACIHPKHLWLGTARDNNQDCASKHRHQFGEHHWRARLSEVTVLELLKKESIEKVNQQEAAKALGVARSTIASIVTGASWRHLHSKMVALSPG